MRDRTVIPTNTSNRYTYLNLPRNEAVPSTIVLLCLALASCGAPQSNTPAAEATVTPSTSEFSVDTTEAVSIADAGLFGVDSGTDSTTAAQSMETQLGAAVDTVSAGSTQAPSDCAQRLADFVEKDLDGELDNYLKVLPELVITTQHMAPVLYLEIPQRAPNKRAAKLSARLGNVRFPPRLRWRMKLKKGMMEQLYRQRFIQRNFRNMHNRNPWDRTLLRDVFLRQGYFFEDRPDVAAVVSEMLRLRDLFNEGVIFALRANRIHRLTRVKRRYVDEQGERFRLRLNDRLATDPDQLMPALHLDLEAVRRTTGALRTVPRKIGERSAWLDLIFLDGKQRAALVELVDGRQQVTCIDGDQESLVELKQRAQRFAQRHEEIAEAAKQMVADRLRFDEPRREKWNVQEDGILRVKWLKAFRRRQPSYSHNLVTYEVYDRYGNPHPPQVCTDFVFDTLERASGTWFPTRGKPPKKTEGRIDFEILSKDLRRRSLKSVLDFAARPDTPLDLYQIPFNERYVFKRRSEFANMLVDHAHDIREGDVLVLYGMRNQDMAIHYHALLVLRTDPLSGLPLLVADNQGRPRISTLQRAMRAAPLRTVRYRIRVDLDWMEHCTKLIRSVTGDREEQSANKAPSWQVLCERISKQ